MKIKLGFDDRTIGTIGVSPEGTFVFEPTTPDDLQTLHQYAESYASNLIQFGGGDPEKSTADDVLKELLDKLQGRMWALEVKDEPSPAQ